MVSFPTAKGDAIHGMMPSSPHKRGVILSGASYSRSEWFAESKDPYSLKYRLCELLCALKKVRTSEQDADRLQEINKDKNYIDTVQATRFIGASR